MALSDFPIPGIHFFISENAFCGSHKGLNYRITPVKANVEENIDSHFEVYTWLGMLSSELSEKNAEATFPLDTDGLAAVKVWLEDQYKTYSEK
jgi:hypothetical protein